MDDWAVDVNPNLTVSCRKGQFAWSPERTTRVQVMWAVHLAIKAAEQRLADLQRVRECVEAPSDRGTWQATA